VRVDRWTGQFETSNVAYRRELLDRLGGFDERFEGDSFGEDVDLGWRALRAGSKEAFVPEAIVRHPVGPRSLRRHLGERWLARGFPHLVREFPELRDRMLYKRFFLTPSSARFLLALVGAAIAPRFRPAVLLTLPWFLTLARESRSQPLLPPVRLLEDAVTAAALVSGSIRSRSLVL
jgi:GT2 family glycosyltransferase